MKNKVKRLTVGYVRSATNNELAIKHQTSEIRKYCRKNQINLHKIYVDNAESGIILHKPSLDRLLKQVSLQTISNIVCVDRDRLSRSYKDYIFLKKYFELFKTNLLVLHETEVLNKQ